MVDTWQNLTAFINKDQVLHFPLDLPGLAFGKASPEHFYPIPWKSLLAGGEDETLKLSLELSENESPNVNYYIRQRWDIDSFIVHAPTLRVHRGGFSLLYKPLYSRRIVQNQQVIIYGYQIYKLKQLQLGHGISAGGFGYNCYVFFPYMPIRKDQETYLSDRAQSI